MHARPDAIEIDPADALALQRDGALLVDVREDDERAAGMPAHALALPLGTLGSRIAAEAPERGRTLLAICASGRRSLRARDELLSLGYADVRSVRGGFARWRAEGLPVAEGLLGADAAQRYARHLVLPEVGVAGQARLGASRVALIGAGGLGAPASLYLAAAGIGHLTLVDDDRVERSNLQRQVVHADARVGMPKVDSARIALEALNPTISIATRETRIVAANVEEVVAGHDVVIDGADNFPTRYLLDAACRRLGIPLVYGAVHRFTGQVSVFDARDATSPCYRCLFPDPPTAAEAPNCSEAGVLGVLPGTIGLLQATEAVKLLLGAGRPLVGRLLCYDALAATFRELGLPRDPACPGCGPGVAFTGYEDIAAICSAE
ncbi:molybdopterin-synthase adenylyltransferase MoeB [Dokdonella sp. MW10]|uniref:molybdopterin-synthase adenylyltransferase MoeB n=1 Tax=Dokdonella sp. MW10 TaxID=2992926 RepID=UPI003F7F2F05